MQVSIWNQYLKKLDAQMRRQGRNILLLIDNAPTHALYETTNLTNITIEHFLPNTIAHLQPCDQGIINNFIYFRHNYRKLFLHNQVKAYDNYNEYGVEPIEIDIKKCIKYVAHAWDNVTQETIENCWSKADILPKTDENEIYMDDDVDIRIYSMHTRELEEIQILIDKLDFEDPFNAKEFIQYDNAETTTEIPSNEEILKAVLPNDQEKEIEEEEPLDLLPPITHNEAINYYDKIILYLVQQESDFDMKKEELKFVKKLKKEALKQRFISARQINLDSFVINEIIN